MATNQPKDLGAEPAAPFAQTTESFQTAYTYHRGLSKREFFCGLALCGYMARGYLHDSDEAAKTCADHADALLAELAGGAQ